MQPIRNEPAPLSVGEIVVVGADIVVGVAATLLFFVLSTMHSHPPAGQERLAQLESEIIGGGLALAAAGTFVAALLLVTRQRFLASCLQIVAVVGGVLFVCATRLEIATALPVAVLVALAVFTAARALRELAAKGPA